MLLYFCFKFPTVLLLIYFKAGDYFFFCSRVLIHFLQVSRGSWAESWPAQEDICPKQLSEKDIEQ